MKLLKEFKYEDMKPNKKCRWCGGKGYVVTIRPDLNALLFREMRPCQCVKKVVRVEDE